MPCVQVMSLSYASHPLLHILLTATIMDFPATSATSKHGCGGLHFPAFPNISPIPFTWFLIIFTCALLSLILIHLSFATFCVWRIVVFTFIAKAFQFSRFRDWLLSVFVPGSCLPLTWPYFGRFLDLFIADIPTFTAWSAYMTTLFKSHLALFLFILSFFYLTEALLSGQHWSWSQVLEHWSFDK